MNPKKNPKTKCTPANAPLFVGHCLAPLFLSFRPGSGSHGLHHPSVAPPSNQPPITKTHVSEAKKAKSTQAHHPSGPTPPGPSYIVIIIITHDGSRNSGTIKRQPGNPTKRGYHDRRVPTVDARAQERTVKRVTGSLSGRRVGGLLAVSDRPLGAGSHVVGVAFQASYYEPRH